MTNKQAVRMSFYAATAATLLLAQPTHAATHYDAVRNFRLGKNPNGVWTYMDGAPLVFRHHAYEGVEGLENWSDDIPYPNGASIIVNTTGSPVVLDQGVTNIPTDYLAMDAEVNRPGANLRFTAPVAGTFHLECRYKALNTDEAKFTALFISLNGGEIFFQNFKPHTHGRFYKTLVLAAGDTIDFLDSGNPRNRPDYIGLDVKIEGP